MKTVETKRDGLKRAFMLTIPAADIEARVNEEVKRLAPQVKMPGFRPGKVPANLIRKMHGESLHQDALNTVVQSGVEQMLAEQGVRPALRPEVKLDNYEQGKDAEVAVEVEALPNVPVPDIDNLQIERLTVPADDKAIEMQLEAIAQGSKRWVDAPKKHAAANGDLVVVDFEGSIAGKLFDGGAGQDMPVELGSGRLIPGFEDQLIGAKVGDKRSVEVKFPDDYPSDQTRGKAATFAVKVKEIKTAGETKIDDELAKTLGLTGIDQLRDLVTSQFEQQSFELTRTHMKRQLLDQLAARHDFPVPQGMVDAEYENILNQLRSEAQNEADPAAAMAEIERDSDEYKRISERRVRLGLLLSEIGAANGVEITSQEMNGIIANAAGQYQGKDREMFLRYVEQEPTAQAQLRAPLYEDKVVDFLFTLANVTDRKASREQLEADLESEEGHVHGPGCGHDHAAPAKGKAKKASKAEPKPVAKKAEAKPAAAKKAEAKLAAVKKAEAKPAPVKKAEAKPAAAKKAAAKPAPVKKAEAKPAAAKKAEAKPAAVKKAEAKPAAAKKAEAKPAAVKKAAPKAAPKAAAKKLSAKGGKKG
ncbi:MAG: trigger factor [Sphingomonas sp.]|nr:trigger factor [Sphingomonas sp.]